MCRAGCHAIIQYCCLLSQYSAPSTTAVNITLENLVPQLSSHVPLEVHIKRSKSDQLPLHGGRSSQLRGPGSGTGASRRQAPLCPKEARSETTTHQKTLHSINMHVIYENIHQRVSSTGTVLILALVLTGSASMNGCASMAICGHGG